MTRKTYIKLLNEFNYELNNCHFDIKSLISSFLAKDITKKFLHEIYFYSVTTNYEMIETVWKKSVKDIILKNVNISQPYFNHINNDKLGGVIHMIIASANPSILNNKETNNFKYYKFKIIQMLLEMGLNPNLKDEMGYTFLETAIIGRPNFISTRDKEKDSNKNRIPAILKNSNSWEFIEDLIKIAKEKSFDVNTKDNLGNSIVHTAISSPYFVGNITNLIESLGENFEIDTCNNAGQNIIEYLDYCIENRDIYTEWGYENTYDIELHINNLKEQRDSIRGYIKLKHNPETSQINFKTFKDKLNYFNTLIKANKRMILFLGYPYTETIINIEKITLNELEQAIQKENYSYEGFKAQIYLILNTIFGSIVSLIIVNFIITGSFTNKKSTKKETEEFIKYCGNLLYETSCYPKRKNKILFNYFNNYASEEDINNIITWLRDCYIEYQKKQHNNGPIKKILLNN